ncbi:MAG: 6-phosphogluconolactonase [Patescibacteria group bacterium]
MDIYKPNLYHHEDEMIMIDSIKNYFLDYAEDAIYNTGTFRIALAGGNTPTTLYCELAKLTIDWSNVEVYQVDERYVDSESANSNYAMLVKCFAEAIDKGLEIIKIPVEKSIVEAVNTYNSEISLLDNPIFDLVILGAGLDGHIGSLFPNGDYLNGETDYVLHTQTKEFEIKDRITLSLSTLLSSKNIIVYLTGEEKYSIVEETFYGHKKAVDYPIKFLFAHPEVDFFYCEEQVGE